METRTHSLSEHPWFDEMDLLGFLADGLAAGSFVDVGAHIGRFSQMFAEKGWSVIAVEAAPAIVDRLRTTLEPYENSRVVACAACDRNDSTVEFYLSEDHWGIHSLQPFHESHRKKVIVEAMRLDSILEDQDYREPLFLKIDTEGADFLALRGWDFDRSRPRLVMTEFMDSRSIPHFGYGFEDVVRFMAGVGYAAYVSEWSEVEQYARQGVETTRSHHLGMFFGELQHDPVWGNLLFVVEEDRSWFEEGLIAFLDGLQGRAWATLAGADRERAMNSRMTATIENRETRISALTDSTDALHARIAELDAAVVHRDVRIAELDAAVVHRDVRIAELDAILRRQIGR